MSKNSFISNESITNSYSYLESNASYDTPMLEHKHSEMSLLHIYNSNISISNHNNKIHHNRHHALYQKRINLLLFNYKHLSFFDKLKLKYIT